MTSEPHFAPDIIIVGAGSSGSLLAARLSEDPARKVLMIEAGKDETDPDIWNPQAWPALQGRSYDWDYVTEPQDGTAGRSHHWARGRMIGGSSCLHAMGYMRGHPDDFRHWAEATGDAQWSWEGLLPAFEANEDREDGAETAGPLPVHRTDAEASPLTHAFIEAGMALGLKRLQGHNDGEMIGVTPNSMNIRNGKRVTVADAWLTDEVRARSNLFILTGSRVRRIVMNGTRVAHLEVSGPDGVSELAAPTILLCAGSLETPALLMRSGIGPKDVLEAAGVDCKIEMAEIGLNLQDHLLGAGNVYATKKHLPPSRLQHSESMCYMKAGDFTATGQPDIVVGCGVAPIVSECFDGPAPGTAFSFLFGVTHPTSRGSLKITGPEPGDPLVIDPNYISTENDREKFRAALKAARTIGQRPELDEWRDHEIYPGSLESDAELDDFIARAAITHHHPCGTCRMGKDEAAVVDADLKLRPLDNLYIVDASVMPTLTAGPIHAAVLAIAETFARTMIARNEDA
ncbi:pyridoxine 4-oxidase [Pseudohoeflea suaedae]|uniref:Pyridoxine 4-oxidase n=1 Tax=Pseudohoeflea suaedae TaxID=877384 RepID=A0A4R5PP71_9HYPH|nr:GMC family oxidoreductase N-terminal domain-containing protein [Pseudohoeflea suaedae]TDH38397.1 pyridoxine 4-oxidase [Pseudohoeflea suaedae]